MVLPELIHDLMSPFCRKVRVVLDEMGVRFSLTQEDVSLRRKEFLALNPAGEVPVSRRRKRVRPCRQPGDRRVHPGCSQGTGPPWRESRTTCGNPPACRLVRQEDVPGSHRRDHRGEGPQVAPETRQTRLRSAGRSTRQAAVAPRLHGKVCWRRASGSPASASASPTSPRPRRSPASTMSATFHGPRRRQPASGTPGSSRDRHSGRSSTTALPACRPMITMPTRTSERMRNPKPAHAAPGRGVVPGRCPAPETRTLPGGVR